MAAARRLRGWEWRGLGQVGEQVICKRWSQSQTIASFGHGSGNSVLLKLVPRILSESAFHFFQKFRILSVWVH